MNRGNLLPTESIELPPSRFAERRAHLLSEIEGSSVTGSWVRLYSFLPFSPRGRLALAVIALVLLGGSTAVAVGVSLLTQEKSFYEEWIARDPDAPNLKGSFVEVAGGSDWALIAWKSDRGICLDIATPGNSASSCGFPVAGAPRDMTQPDASELEHQVAYLAGTVGPSEAWDIAGVAAAGIERVQIELADGSTLAPEMYEAPAQLGTELRFFHVRAQFDPSTLPPGERPVLSAFVRTFLAYNANGELLERLPVFPTPADSESR